MAFHSQKFHTLTWTKFVAVTPCPASLALEKNFGHGPETHAMVQIIHAPDMDHDVSRLRVVTAEVPVRGVVVIGRVEVPVVFSLDVCL